MARLIMLKLGGSLITDKDKENTPQREVLANIIQQIAAWRSREPSVGLILGHGSGSFGHAAASKHHTGEGLDSGEDHAKDSGYWQGFSEVHYRAAQLSGIVMDALHRSGIPAVAFPPVAGVIVRDHQVRSWDIAPMRIALAVGMVPVVYGDVAFDEVRGGTILSTEELFAYLARHMHPEHILLAGLEAGVWEDFPERRKLARELTPASYERRQSRPGASVSIDVTGGMGSKVLQMLDLLQDLPGLQVQIFAGGVPGAIERALGGDHLGTWIHADAPGRRAGDGTDN